MDLNAAGERRSGWIIALLILSITLLYLLFPTRNYFFDGIDFAHTIEQTPTLSASLTHPNHLIYNVIGWLFYRLVLALGFSVRAVAALQILNAVLSALTAYVLFLILKSCLRSTYLCYCLTLLFAFSATWWKFSTDADAYIPSVLFVTISFWLALPNRKSNPAIVAAAYTVALCFHQIAIVFFPVLVLAMFIQPESASKLERLLNAITFAVTSTLLTLVAYLYSFYRITGTLDLRRFLRWTMSYAPDESFGFHAWNNLTFTVRGHFRLFFGGRLNAISGLINPVIAALIVVLGIVVVLFLFKLVRHFRSPGWEWLRQLRNDRTRSRIAFLCLVWISVYILFLYFLLAHHTFYRLFYLPAIIILIGLALDSYTTVRQSSRKYRLVLFVVALIIANFLTLIYPYTHAQKFPPLELALHMNTVWPPGTVVYFSSNNSDNSLVRYFNQGTTWQKLDRHAKEVSSESLHDAEGRGATVWLETTAIDQIVSTPQGKEWLNNHTKPDAKRELISKAHNIRFVQIFP